MTWRIIDAAEAWLMEHDPEYAKHREKWKHVNGSVDVNSYITPSQEICWDEDEYGSVADLVDQGKAQLLRGGGLLGCESCGGLFEPQRRDGNRQRFCSERCRKRDENKRLRMRGSNDT